MSSQLILRSQIIGSIPFSEEMMIIKSRRYFNYIKNEDVRNIAYHLVETYLGLAMGLMKKHSTEESLSQKFLTNISYLQIRDLVSLRRSF